MSIKIPESQRALIFQGGGALGAYEVGFYQAVYEKFIQKSPNEIKEIFLETKIKDQSILAMVDIMHPRFNEGQPIVFEGKLTDTFGNPISYAPILIKSDGPCPVNQIIAQGITDKHGRYKIFTKALLWDEHDGLITTFAKFPGNVIFEQSISDPQLIVVYPVKGEKCIG